MFGFIHQIGNISRHIISSEVCDNSPVEDGGVGQLTFQLLAQQLPLLVELGLQLLQSRLGLRQLQLQRLLQQRDLTTQREKQIKI